MRARVRADYLIALFTIFRMTLALGSGGLSVGRVGRGQAIADNPTAISGRPAGERMVSVGPRQRRGRVLPPLLCPGYRWRNVNVFVSLPLSISSVFLYVAVFVFVFLSFQPYRPHITGWRANRLDKPIRPVHNSMG